MTYDKLKKRKSQLFEQIMISKYAGIKPKYWIVKEYRFLQREQIRMIKSFKESVI